MPFGLGDRASVGLLKATEVEAESIRVTTLQEGVHLGSHLKIGDTTTSNTASINQTDSLLHVNYAFYLNVLGGAVQDGSAILALTTTTTHNLKPGDTVEIEHATGLGDINANLINGEHVLATGTTGTALRVTLSQQASASENNAAFTCGVHGTHYRYLDLAADTAEWTRATKLPTTTAHKNVNPPATWAPY